MNAIRKVLTVKDNNIHLKLPSEFNNTDVEVLIFRVKDENNTGKVPAKISFGGSLQNSKKEDIEAKLKNLRSEWDRLTF